MSSVLELHFTSADAFAETLARHLRRGRAFVPGAQVLDVLTPVELVVIEPGGGRRRFEAVVVMAPAEQAAQGGVGLMLDGDWEGVLESEPEPGPAAQPATEPEREEDGESTDRQDAPLHLRIKRMSNAEQLQLARLSTNIQERTLLERMLGKQGWEPLLGNARITVPEVAKIARKGTVPRPLIERIVDNRSWLQAPSIRRALLSNPKLARDGVTKVLRATPKHELKLMVKGTAYPSVVRENARRILAGKAR